jgi:integrase
MAWVIKRQSPTGKESPYWTGVFMAEDANGRRKQYAKSTKQTSRKAALLVAEEWERTARKIAAGRISAVQARQALDEILEDVTGEAAPRYTVRAWIAEWRKQKDGAAKDKTMERYGATLDKFLAFLGPKADRPLDSLTPTVIREFREKQMARGKSAHTCNLDLKIIAMPLRAAARNGYLLRNPCDAVETLATDTESKQPFTMEQVEKLLAAAEGEWRGMILVGLYTGARLGDVARLRWKNVDLATDLETNLPTGTLRFLPAKSDRKKKRGKELVLPLHPTLAAYLLKLPSSDDAEAFIFPEQAARKMPGRSGLSMTFAGIMHKAGIVSEVTRKRKDADGEGVTSAGRTGRALTFHSLRHTLTSIMHNAGVSVEIRQLVTGHASAEMNRRYSHTDPETLRDALEKVPSLNL